MIDRNNNLSEQPPWPEIMREIRLRTPARIFVKRGAAYSTQMQLELRGAHAKAVDAVWSEFDLKRDLPAAFVAQWKLFQVSSQADAKSQFLLRPDLGRKLSEGGRVAIGERCLKAAEVQVVIGDGLSVAAVSTQVPRLLPLVREQFQKRGWAMGQTFCVRYCRVGIMNDIGDLLLPKVLVLLIGERPGLATVESLSAYMGYRPKKRQSDADRNLISNIHDRGIPVEEAAERITNLAATMMAQGRSGTGVREELAGAGRSRLSG